MNFSETATIARQFEEGGYSRAGKGEQADICIINTCSVTEHADKKCRNLIRKLIKNNPGAVVAVTGCYAQLKADEIAAIEGVDIVVGNGDKGSLFDKVRALTAKGKPGIYGCDSNDLTTFFSAFSTSDRTRAFLKVQDGCDYRCSYCTIPAARGSSRNLPIAELAGEAEKISSAGIKEIVITGINTGDFGRTTGENFIDLLKTLDRIEGIGRYRISSIEPNLLTDEIIDFTASSDKFMPHFHIPLQSGSDTVLSAMRRRYTTAKFRERIEALRQRIPDAFIGIDIICGFPGETDELFAETVVFLKEIQPSFLHVFPFSVRRGTPAADMDNKISPDVISQRVKVLTELSANFHNAYIDRHIGEEAYVLYESNITAGYMTGFTDNYIKVRTPLDRTKIGGIYKTRLMKNAGEAAEGEIIQEL